MKKLLLSLLFLFPSISHASNLNVQVTMYPGQITSYLQWQDYFGGPRHDATVTTIHSATFTIQHLHPNFVIYADDDTVRSVIGQNIIDFNNPATVYVSLGYVSGDQQYVTITHGSNSAGGWVDVDEDGGN